MPPAAINFLFGLTIAGALVAFASYDWLVMREHVIAPDAWDDDGRPPGFIWAARGTRMNWWARQKTFLRWTWTTPDWARTDSAAHAAQLGLRTGYFVCVLAALATLVLLVLP